MAQQDDFSGMWRVTYWYPSNEHRGEDVSEYYVSGVQTGKKLILESLPNTDESYILVRLTIDGNLATGTWEETTSPHGEFEGAIYSGALQLLVSKDQKRLEGMWVGIGQDHESEKPQIYSGRWEIVRAGNKTDDTKTTAK